MGKAFGNNFLVIGSYGQKSRAKKQKISSYKAQCLSASFTLV